MVLYGFLWLTLRLLAGAAPLTRYVVLCLGLLGLVACTAGTFLMLESDFDDPGPLVLRAVEPHSSSHNLKGVSTLTRTVRWASTAVTALWIVGAVTVSLRHFAAWIWLHRVWLQAARPLRSGWDNLGELALRMGLPGVRFLESTLTDVPATLDWLKPVVLLPPALLTGLSVQQVEAIVAHELAHVLRRDYLVNLLQGLAEATLFYHPVIWWLTARIREEREHCCDDIAAGVAHGTKAYALALVALEEQRAFAPPSRLAMAATAGPLLRRIARLISHSRAAQPTYRPARPLIVSLAAAGVVIIVASQLGGSAILIRPSRTLTDVRSLAQNVQKVLNVRGHQGSVLPLVEEAVAARRAGTLDADVARRLAEAFNRSAGTELLAADLAEVSLEEPRAHQQRDGWRYGLYYERMQIAHELWGFAQERSQVGASREARLLARGAMLLLAQDSLMFGASPLRSLLRDPRFVDIALRDARQTARLRRDLEDHRTVSRAFIPELRCAEELLAAATASGAPPDLIPAMRRMARLAKHRPDIQWCIANVKRRGDALATPAPTSF